MRTAPAASTNCRRANRSSCRAGRARRWLTVVLAAVAAVVAAVMPPVGARAASTLTWSVRPTPTAAEPERPNFSFDLEPGATLHDSIRIRNYSEQPLHLDVYASDAVMTASGSLDVLPAEQQPVDVGAWITLDVEAIDVPVDAAVDVPFTVTVPADAEPGDHTGGIVTSFRSPSRDDEGRPVVLDRRLGTRLHLRVAGDLRPLLEITDLDVDYRGTTNPAAPGRVQVDYTLTNRGNVRAGASLSVRVDGRFGSPDRAATPEPITELLPGASRRVTVEIRDVWPTLRSSVRVTATPLAVRPGDVFRADAGAAQQSASAWSIPWPAIGLLAALVATPLVMLRRRRTRRRREAAMVADAVDAALASAAGRDETAVSTPGAR